MAQNSYLDFKQQCKDNSFSIILDNNFNYVYVDSNIDVDYSEYAFKHVPDQYHDQLLNLCDMIPGEQRYFDYKIINGKGLIPAHCVITKEKGFFIIKGNIK